MGFDKFQPKAPENTEKRRESVDPFKDDFDFGSSDITKGEDMLNGILDASKPSQETINAQMYDQVEGLSRRDLRRIMNAEKADPNLKEAAQAVYAKKFGGKNIPGEG